MKYLIVNADDFGACSGVNRGIVEAHRQGIVTSASLMVEMPGSEEAAKLAGEFPTLSVGLHAFFEGEHAHVVADPDASRAALDDQLIRFTELMGRPPTHLDSHHHVHTAPGLLPHFREVAEQCGIPLRASDGVRYCSRFYGQSAGQSRPEQVSFERLAQILATEVGHGVTEIGCHPGSADDTLVSSYTIEREHELNTLCDRRLRGVLDAHAISLISFAEMPRLVGRST